MTDFITALFSAVIVFLICVLIIGTVVMWLWNFLMPTIFGLPELTWLQSLGMYALAQMFFQSRVTLNNSNKKH